MHVETVAGYIIRRYWHGCCTKNRSSEGHIYFQCILCILHQKSLKRGHYRCSAYYTTQSCSFLLEFTTGNVVTLALLLTRPRCVRFITLTFDGKDLHIHPDNRSYNWPKISCCSCLPKYWFNLVLSEFGHRISCNGNSRHFWGRLEFFWFLTNGLTDSGSPRSRLIILTFHLASEVTEEHCIAFLTCGNFSTLPMLTMMLERLHIFTICCPRPT